MPIPAFGTPFGYIYEHYASQSGLTPRYGYSKDQHEYRFFAAASGLSDFESLGAHQRAVWRAQSGLTPADNYTDANLTPSWLNGAEGAPSVLLAPRPNHTSSANSASNAVGVGQAIKDGQAWLMLSPRSTGNDTAMTAVGLTLTPGKTYTALAKLRLDAPQTGSTNERARRIAFYDSVRGWNNLQMSDRSPNEAGTYQHRLVFTYTEGSTAFQLRFYSGGSNNSANAYWTDIAVVEGEYYGDYFDGDMPNVLWSGVRHDSTSNTFNS